MSTVNSGGMASRKGLVNPPSASAARVLDVCSAPSARGILGRMLRAAHGLFVLVLGCGALLPDEVDALLARADAALEPIELPADPSFGARWSRASNRLAYWVPRESSPTNICLESASLHLEPESPDAKRAFPRMKHPAGSQGLTPNWSPDGTAIALTSSSTHSAMIHRLEPESTPPVSPRLTPSDAITTIWARPSWSPDSSEFAILVLREEARRWSSDAGRMVPAHRDAAAALYDRWEVARCDLEGNVIAERVLAEDSDGPRLEIGWSPDGEVLLVIGDHKLFALDAASLEDLHEPIQGLPALHLGASPVRWSPDSRRAVAVAGGRAFVYERATHSVSEVSRLAFPDRVRPGYVLVASDALWIGDTRQLLVLGHQDGGMGAFKPLPPSHQACVVDATTAEVIARGRTTHGTFCEMWCADAMSAAVRRAFARWGS